MSEWFPGALIWACPKRHASAVTRLEKVTYCPVCSKEFEATWRYRVGPFQRAVFEAIDREKETLMDIEARCGWDNSKGYLTRVLGLRAGATSHRASGRRYQSTAVTISYENAHKLANALDLDLVQWEI